MYTVLAIYGKAQEHNWKTTASAGQAEITASLPRAEQAGARAVSKTRC